MSAVSNSAAVVDQASTQFAAGSPRPWPVGRTGSAEWLVRYMRLGGWEPYADESHVWLVTRRPLSRCAAELLAHLSADVHALLLQEQGHPVAVGEHPAFALA